MNNDEIREALKIINEPITVNCIEYKYFDQENYNKLIKVFENCLWFANNLEQINLTTESLEQENQKLKAQYCERTDCSGRIGNSKKVEQLQTEKEQLNSLVNSCQEEIRRLKLQLQQRDEVINKVKKYNEQIIKDTKDFYRPTSDRIYSGDCLIDIATQIIKTLDNKGE